MQSLHFEHLLGLFAQLASDSSLQNPGGLDFLHAGFSQMSPAVFPEQASTDPCRGHVTASRLICVLPAGGGGVSAGVAHAS